MYQSVAAGATAERTGRYQRLLSQLNHGRSALAEARHVSTTLFGPAMHVEKLVLGNGLRLLLLEDGSAPVVSLQLWLNVGSRHDRPGKTGIAHLFEHLMFAGTEVHPRGELDRLLEEAGAETNAATFLDWTYYHTNLPRDALQLSIDLEADRMARLALRDPEVSREKEVVANERRERVDDDVDGAVSELLYKEAFVVHGYGSPTIGWMEDIQGFTTDDCASFYRTYYAPNNAALVIVGDIAPSEVVRWVQDAFGGLAPADIPIEDVHPEPAQVQERRKRTQKPTPTHKVALGYKAPALGDFDHAPLVLLNEILFGGRSSRAHRALIQDQAIASDVRGAIGAFRDPSLYDIFLAARGKHTGQELVASLDAIFESTRREPVSQSELDRAKARIELGALQGLETVGGKAEQIGFFEMVLGDPTALFDKLAAYRRTTRADLLRVARRYLVDTARTVIEVLPDGSCNADTGPAHEEP